MKRFLLVRQLGSAGQAPAEDDEAPVWGLFRDRAAMERQFTTLVRENLGWQHQAAPAEA